MGGTKIQAAILGDARTLGHARVPTPQGGPATVLKAVMSTIKSASAQAAIPPEDLEAIGVGFPGVYDQATGDVINAPNIAAFQRRYPLGTRISQALGGAPVVLENDVRAAILGEHRAGAGRPFRDLLGVFLGTGVGGGLILDGAVRRGQGAAGEIGHTVVRNGGRPCGCGRRGCLEAYAGRARMELRAQKLVLRGRRTILFKLMAEKGRDRITSGVMAEALERGDKLAAGLIDDAVWALAASLASIHNVLDLQAIIIGGGLGDRLGPPFIERVGKAMQPHLLMSDRPPALLPTQLGDLSGAVGAALLAADGVPTRRRQRRPRTAVSS